MRAPGECVAPSSSVAVATSPAITVTVTDWQTKMVTKYKQGSTTTIHDCATPTAKQTHHHGHHHSKEKKPKKEKPTFPHTSETTSDELTEVATQVQATSSWVAVPSPETTAPSTVRAPETAAGTTAWQPAVSSYVAQDEPWSEPAPSPEPSQANTGEPTTGVSSSSLLISSYSGCAHDKCCDCKEPDADENCPDGW